MSGSFIGFFIALAVVSLFVVGIIKVSRAIILDTMKHNSNQ